MATRDRPVPLRRALRSIAAQRLQDCELLLVDDSDDPALREESRACLRACGVAARYLSTAQSDRGRGAGFARNIGLSEAAGDFIAFLDDDDEWTDPDYLARAAVTLAELEAELHFADQEAVLPGGERRPGPIWIEDLGTVLAAPAARSHGGRLVTASELMRSAGFAHLNTTIARRDLVWGRAGGFDPNLRYEEDRDLYLRLIDRATRIAYTPRIVARHYIPAGAARSNASSRVSLLEKQADQLSSNDKLLATLSNPVLVERVRRDRAWLLRRMAIQASAAGDHAAAFQRGVSALRSSFGFKWLGYTAWLALRRALSG